MYNVNDNHQLNMCTDVNKKWSKEKIGQVASRTIIHVNLQHGQEFPKYT